MSVEAQVVAKGKPKMKRSRRQALPLNRRKIQEEAANDDDYDDGDNDDGGSRIVNHE